MLGIGAKIGMRSEVVGGVSTGVGVLVVGNVWDGEEVMRMEHTRGHPCTEFLYLVMDVLEEGITGPAADLHDSENWHPSKVHCHGCTQSYGVGANITQ